MDLSSTILEVGHKVRPVVGKIVPQFIIDKIYAKVTSNTGRMAVHKFKTEPKKKFKPNKFKRGIRTEYSSFSRCYGRSEYSICYTPVYFK